MLESKGEDTEPLKCELLSLLTFFWPDVGPAAAAAVGGPAEEGGRHQEDQRWPGCRGPQGARYG